MRQGLFQDFGRLRRGMIYVGIKSKRVLIVEIERLLRRATAARSPSTTAATRQTQYRFRLPAGARWLSARLRRQSSSNRQSPRNLGSSAW